MGSDRSGVRVVTGVLQGGHGTLAWGAAWLCVVACIPAGVRWLRVAQREHYLAGSCAHFAVRWWFRIGSNAVLAAAALSGAVLAVVWPPAALATGAAVAVGPLGLSLRGRTSPLAWTRRLRTLAAVWSVLEGAVVALSIVVDVPAIAALAALAVPLLVDAACAVTGPLERSLSEHFVTSAATRLRRVHPVVVAITGSYGKTSTKNHVVHLVQGSLEVVATPASFNNRAGLARSVNEHLADGTEVFVAEMGTYGPGEIADLCRWCPPTVAVITAIGPVHLERFGTEERIVVAKSEITMGARDVVLQVDDPRLAAVADRLVGEGRHVVRCSALDPTADVCVALTAAGADAPGVPAGDPTVGSPADPTGSRATLSLDGTVVADGLVLPVGVQPANLACSIAVARCLGVEASAIVARVADLPAVAHRLQVVRAVSGASLLDDTYNSNPAGARAALHALSASPGPGAPGRRVVGTPGMVELGKRQFEENRLFGVEIAAVATDLVVVGRTNRRALVAGATGAPGRSGATISIVELAHRSQAVEWVREQLGPDDAVLYENDLPDHYP